MPVDQSNMAFTFAMLSSVGRVRSGNEDFCTADAEHGIFVVCDGMGGAAAGEIASQLAASTFLQHLTAALPLPDATEPLLNAAAVAANAAVLAHAKGAPELRGMGTTLVALLLCRHADGETAELPAAPLWLTHVGDSRCYRLRNGNLEQLTQDHSLVQEQVAAGHLTQEQAERSPMRNIITRAIGSAGQLQAEIRALDPQPGDLYLLASDGLTRELDDARLATILQSADPSALEDLCEGLIDAANAAGGHDNVTVLVLRIGS
jgi:serine/threonine protein phosphatase PrpC